MNKIIILCMTSAVFYLSSCSSKVDPKELNHANMLVNTGNFEEGIAQLENFSSSHADDAALKQSLIAAHMKYAQYFMYNDSLSHKVKYPNALKHYTAVLQIDSTNKDARENADMIIGIYQSMGREVPSI